MAPTARPSLPTTGEDPGAAGQTLRTARPPSVLIVEDEPVTAEVFERVLRQAGHRVRIARDGIAALGMLQRRLPDVVILDVGLPTLSGVEVVRRMRADLGPHVPVVMVSGTPRVAVPLSTDDLLPGLWLHKPIRPRELVAAVARVLRRPDGRDAGQG